MEAIIETYSGKQANILEPEKSEIVIEDIAHALSNQCRFTGHTKRFYSVAQHSCAVHDLLKKSHPAQPYLQLIGLMHDASEAYLSDIASPWKTHVRVGKYSYMELEKMWMEHIFNALKIPQVRTILTEVNRADEIMLHTEAAHLMNNASWADANLVDDSEFWHWTPYKAEQEFLNRWQELMPVTGGV